MFFTHGAAWAGLKNPSCVNVHLQDLHDITLICGSGTKIRPVQISTSGQLAPQVTQEQVGAPLWIQCINESIVWTTVQVRLRQHTLTFLPPYKKGVQWWFIFVCGYLTLWRKKKATFWAPSNRSLMQTNKHTILFCLFWNCIMIVKCGLKGLNVKWFKCVAI